MPLHQHVRALLVYVDFIHCRSDSLTTDGCFCRITSQTVFFLQLLSSVSVETEKQPQIQQWCSCTDATLAPVGSHDILFFSVLSESNRCRQETLTLEICVARSWNKIRREEMVSASDGAAAGEPGAASWPVGLVVVSVASLQLWLVAACLRRNSAEPPRRPDTQA